MTIVKNAFLTWWANYLEGREGGGIWRSMVGTAAESYGTEN